MVDCPERAAPRSRRRFKVAISALGHQLKELARPPRAPGQDPESEIPVVSLADGPLVDRLVKKVECLLPWGTMIKPTQHQRVMIDAHRDDWP